MSKAALRAKTAKLELDHPAEGKAAGWVLEVIGFDSTALRGAIKRIAVARAERPIDDKALLDKMNADEQDNADIAAAAVVGWNDAFAGAVGPYSAETAIELMRDVEITWVREQVENCLRKRVNFFRPDDKQPS